MFINVGVPYCGAQKPSPITIRVRPRMSSGNCHVLKGDSHRIFDAMQRHQSRLSPILGQAKMLLAPSDWSPVMAA